MRQGRQWVCAAVWRNVRELFKVKFIISPPPCVQMALVQPAAGPMSGTLLGAARPGTMGLCGAAAHPITYIVSACILNTRHANNI